MSKKHNRGDTQQVATLAEPVAAVLAFDESSTDEIQAQDEVSASNQETPAETPDVAGDEIVDASSEVPALLPEAPALSAVKPSRADLRAARKLNMSVEIQAVPPFAGGYVSCVAVSALPAVYELSCLFSFEPSYLDALLSDERVSIRILD